MTAPMRPLRVGDRVAIGAIGFRTDETGTVTAVHDRPRTYKVAVVIDKTCGDRGPYLFSFDELTREEADDDRSEAA